MMANSLRNKTILDNAIGVFDSGIGGLSVLTEIRKSIPRANLIYFGDQAHVPYGPRPLEQVQQFSIAISKFLMAQGAKMIVVACNAASAASLKELRRLFPQVPIVGMEPAVKPAAEQTLSGAVGVLATPATFQSELYASVVERFANGVNVFQSTCPGLVNEIESGNFAGEKTRKILEEALLPMLANKIDSVVLGCTHYPYVLSIVKSIVGPDVRVINPAPAVAKQTAKLFGQLVGASYTNPVPVTEIITSADKQKLIETIREFFPFENHISNAKWVGPSLIANVTQ
jgi:glutamate racemase